MPADINMFWHGPVLGPIHAACVRSFLRHGHAVTMHCYERPADLPDGVAVFDARKIMPLEDLRPHSASGSIALGSDRYRYRLIAEGFGTYADCDMFCLRPIAETPYIMGAEQANTVNGAILNYPPDSPFCELLREATQDYNYVPPWFSESKQRKMRFFRKFGRKVSVEALGWGIWGPHLITHLVKRLDLWTEVSNIDRFYPLHCQHAVQLKDPELCIADLTTPRTDALHLWHKISGSTAPPGSPLDEIINC